MKISTLLISSILLLTGCATTVPMSDMASSNTAKTFQRPSEGKAGLYVYRQGGLGSALTKDIWVDGECLGQSAPNVFFFREVEGNQTHTVATQSEFSPNLLSLYTEAGKNYFVRQYMKIGVFVGGANVVAVSEQEGQAAVASLNMAQSGHCSKPFHQ